jgi:hypothetical protein
LESYWLAIIIVIVIEWLLIGLFLLRRIVLFIYWKVSFWLTWVFLLHFLVVAGFFIYPMELVLLLEPIRLLCRQNKRLDVRIDLLCSLIEHRYHSSRYYFHLVCCYFLMWYYQLVQDPKSSNHRALHYTWQAFASFLIPWREWNILG